MIKNKLVLMVSLISTVSLHCVDDSKGESMVPS